MIIDEGAGRGKLEIRIIFEPPNVLIEVEGIGRIAKREDGKWVSTKPGWIVYSPRNHESISVSYSPVDRRRRKSRRWR